MRYTVVKSILSLVGYDWMHDKIAMDVELSQADLDAARDKETGEVTADGMNLWVVNNRVARFGDFQSICDFCGDLEDGDKHIDIDWHDQEWGDIYHQCMNPEEFEYSEMIDGVVYNC